MYAFVIMKVNGSITLSCGLADHICVKIVFCVITDVALHILERSITLFILDVLQIISYLNSRCKVHKDTIRFCQDVLQSKYIEWEPVTRDTLCRPIRHVDLVITIGGDGTLLRASHFLDDSIPVLGVNSDPTQVEEVTCSGPFTF